MDKAIPISTVGRRRGVKKSTLSLPTMWQDEYITATCDDSLDAYANWPTPTAIVSDGAYGILGFEGDTSDHLGIPAWYEPHVKAWSKYSTPQTTLWFWNSEIGWAAAHPVLEKYGWRYVNANIWNKGIGHVAGNINTKMIRRFPVVSELCVQYVYEARIDGLLLKEWLLREWKRSGLPMNRANDACGVKNAATRKYFDQGHLWYYPPVEMFDRIQSYANKFGNPKGKPYFSINGNTPLTGEEWSTYRSKFNCPHGVTNVWNRNALHGKERYKVNGSNGKSIHLNQKPLDLMSYLIEASTDQGDIVWEPFAGLFSASIAARNLRRFSFGAEINQTYFHFAYQRLNDEIDRYSNP